jgi:pimeloyl-ACP methyl ester carboxylesterase
MTEKLHSTETHGQPALIPVEELTERFRSRTVRPGRLPITLIIILIVSLCGCAAPIGVQRVGLEAAYREINANALTGTKLSPETTIVLQRFDLVERFEKDPAAAIALLHEKATRDPRRDLRFALAELSFYHGKHLEQRPIINGHPTGAADYYLMAALYAYYFLLGPASEAQAAQPTTLPTNPYDHQVQVAAALYNQALSKGFATGPDGRLEFQNALRHLPVGDVEISLDSKALPWPLEDFTKFLPADDYIVYGLSIRNRTPGLGLPLIGVHKKTPDYPKGPVMPITAFLRVTGGIGDLGEKTARATLEFFSAFEETDLTVNGRPVPMETDSTAPLAYRLSDTDIWWEFGLHRFFSGEQQKPELILMQPYLPGRIPVVFIHGTASSPLWWAEMWNTLRSDPAIRRRYQFWFFMYNSGISTSISAAALRDTLTATVAKLDPDGKDAALHQMVLVGHSQGGLLANFSVVKSGDTLWNAISKVSLDDLDVGPETKQQIRHYMFIEPLPFVTRVVYIATPHRGSFRATSWVQNIMRRMITLPHDLLTTNPAVYLHLSEQLKLPSELRTKTLTSVDSQSPDNPVLKALVQLPTAPGVTTHSIIAVQGKGDPTKGNDGVVTYASAHIDSAESEYIVRDQHSCQGNPLVIEEVRRILLVHLASLDAAKPNTKGE